MKKRRRAMFGLRVLAVLVMTLVTIILTFLSLFQVISLETFVIIFAAWYLLTVIFMLVTGGVRISDAEEEERTGRGIPENHVASGEAQK